MTIAVYMGPRAVGATKADQKIIIDLEEELQAERARNEALIVSRDISERGRVELRERVAQLEAALREIATLALPAPSDTAWAHSIATKALGGVR